MNKTEVNVFIENEYKNFETNIDLEKLRKDTECMVKYFLSQKDLVEESCLKGYECKLLYFDVVLLNDENIKEINKNYRSKDCPTDVITFAIFADSPKEERFVFDDEINLGEIMISLDTAKLQSENNKHYQTSLKDELYFLLAHGILHLMGYDHKDEESLKKMWDMQNEMIKGACKNV